MYSLFWITQTVQLFLFSYVIAKTMFKEQPCFFFSQISSSNPNCSKGNGKLFKLNYLGLFPLWKATHLKRLTFCCAIQRCNYEPGKSSRNQLLRRMVHLEHVVSAVTSVLWGVLILVVRWRTFWIRVTLFDAHLWQGHNCVPSFLFLWGTMRQCVSC